MIVRPSERGTALLTVLLLVAVMATIASTLLDRIGVATQLAANARTAGQARAWLTTAEAIATARIEDLIAAQPDRLTARGGWLATRRSISLPDGGVVDATLFDGGNCFNLNALARPVDHKVLATRPDGIEEFVALMAAIGIPESRARQIAARTADYIDDDDLPQRGGVERGGYPEGSLPANRMMADASELRSVPGVTNEEWRRLAPWLCALPLAGGSPVNVNTVRPEEAALLVMLSKGAMDMNRARALIAGRPPAGYASASEVIPASDRVDPADRAAAPGPAVTTRFFRLVVSAADVRGGDDRYTMTSLIDATPQYSRVIARRWGTGG